MTARFTRRIAAPAVRAATVAVAVAITLAAALAALPRAARADERTVEVRGLVDIVAQGQDDERYLNITNMRDSNFDPLRARLFIDAARGNTQLFLQVLFSGEAFDGTRLYGAYVMHRPWEQKDVWVEAGLIPVHDGIWAAHTYSNKNPLIALPMAYYWKTNLPNHQMPVDMDQLLTMRGRGQFGTVYEDSTGIRGQRYSNNTILYDNCWNYGLYTLGTLGNFEFATGITYGTTGAPVQALDVNENLGLHAKLGYAITAGLSAWVSVARGAYLSRNVSQYLPEGNTVNDYFQDLVALSVDWRWRNVATLGEFFYNHFDTPLRAGGLSNTSFYVQSVYTLTAGWDLAARYDEMRFEEVTGSAGAMAWDQNVQRIEGGVVYHASRNLILKGVLQATAEDGEWSSDYLIPAIQASMSF
jgi:hypothetical protein